MKDLDFENYRVENDRAQHIRSMLSIVRERASVDALQLLAQEFGVEEQEADAGEDAPKLPGFGSLKKSVTKRYQNALPILGEHRALEIRSQETQVRLFVDGTSLLEFTLLPKADEFVIDRIAENQTEMLLATLEVLSEEVKRAKSKKSERQDKWRSRFGGAKAVASTSVEAASETPDTNEVAATESAAEPSDADAAALAAAEPSEVPGAPESEASAPAAE